jgi:hypothetical protein
MVTKQIAIEKERDNLEDLIVIWLDEDSQSFNTQTRLRCIINFLKIFTDIDRCLEYIQSVSNEYLFIIISGQLSVRVQKNIYH